MPNKTDVQKAVEQVATPRTSACFERRQDLIRKYGAADGVGEECDAGNPFVLARQLERELTAANAERDAIVDATCEAGCSVGDLTIDGVMKIRVKNLRAEAAESLVSAAPPEGMVEVPVEPTDEILDAMARVRSDSVAADLPIFGYAHLRRLYKAMIAARPVAAPLREALTREEIEDLRNEICPANGWVESEIGQFHALCDMAIRALSAAPNNAGEPQQGDFAAAQNERPDRASGDRGTLLNTLIYDLRAEALRLNDEAQELYAEDDPHADLAAEPIEAQRGRLSIALNVLEDIRAGHILKTASSANGNAVAGESPDARDARWISVSERLPDASGEVFDVLAVWSPEGAAEWSSSHENNRKQHAGVDVANSVFVHYNAQWFTHWMPLPKPPVDAAMGSPTDDPKKGDMTCD